MNISNVARYGETSLSERVTEIASWVYETPAEAIAFAVAGVVSRLFGLPFTACLWGIGTGLFTAKLVLKIMDSYNKHARVELSKRACKLNRDLPKLQLIIFIATLIVGTISPTMGFILGAGLGSYGAVILNIENYKLIQHANRRKRS